MAVVATGGLMEISSKDDTELAVAAREDHTCGMKRV